MANATTTPLDGSGDLCVFASTSVDLVVDVSGYYSQASAGRYVPSRPEATDGQP